MEFRTWMVRDISMVRKVDTDEGTIDRELRIYKADKKGLSLRMKSDYEAEQAIQHYGDMVKRICFLHLKNHHDTEDIFQTVFLKYLLYSGTFENEEHERAWLARITFNACKDLLKSFHHKRMVPMDAIAEEAYSAEDDKKELLQVVLTLPEKYKSVIYLFYYENYTAVEIAEVLGKSENTIYTWLSRGKKILRKEIGGEEFE